MYDRISRAILHGIGRPCLGLLTGICVLVGANDPARAEQPPESVEWQSPRISKELETILGWLPEDTESLMVARGRYRPAANRPAAGFSVVEPAVYEVQVVDGKQVLVPRNHEPVRRPQTPAELAESDKKFLQAAIKVSGLAMFEHLGPAFMAHVAAQPLRLTLSASRKFGPVTGIPGGSPFEGCMALIFDRAIPEGKVTIDERHQASNVEIGERTLLVVKTRDDWGDGKKLTLYFCHAEPNVLLAATDERFLKTVLTRMDRPARSRAFPPELTEWKSLRTDADIWGIRHWLKRASADAEPTAFGLTYFLDAQAGHELNFSYCSGDELTDEKVASLADVFGEVGDKRLKSRRLARNAAEVRLPADKVDALYMTTLLMGYVVCP